MMLSVGNYTLQKEKITLVSPLESFNIKDNYNNDIYQHGFWMVVDGNRVNFVSQNQWEVQNWRDGVLRSMGLMR